MKDYDKAFPVFDKALGEHQCVDGGMTIKQYAAIHLKVPRSGDSELDDLIRQSVRKDFAEEAMKVLFSEHSFIDKETVPNMADSCFVFAGAMLAEWEKEAGRHEENF
jgi:hypothetical protein